VKEIPLTGGKVALVDDEDFDRLSKFKWFAARCGKNYYAKRAVRNTVTGKQKVTNMNIQVAGDPPMGWKWKYQDGSGLNSQKRNLELTLHTNNKGICKIDGCSEKAYCLGYCKMHYDRTRTGSPNVEIPNMIYNTFGQEGMTNEEKFLARIIKRDSECWEWRGPFYKTGKIEKFTYGRLPIKQENGKWKCVFAHRFSYEYFVGPIPKGKDVHHKCDNQICVNPDHLEPLTKPEHMLESSWPSSLNLAKDQCPNGHDPYEYAKLSTTGHRHRLQCARERKGYYRQRYLSVVRPKVLGNPKYKPRDKIRKEDITSIVSAYDKGEATQTHLSKIYGVDPSTISKLITTERRRTNAPTP